MGAHSPNPCGPQCPYGNKQLQLCPATEPSTVARASTYHSAQATHNSKTTAHKNNGYKQAPQTRAINIQSSGGGGGNDKPYQRLRCPTSSHQGRPDPSSSASLVGPQHLRKGGRAGCGWLAVSGARRFMYMCPLRWTGSVQHVRLCDTCSVTRQARCEVQQTCHAFAFFAARHACTGGER